MRACEGKGGGAQNELQRKPMLKQTYNQKLTKENEDEVLKRGKKRAKEETVKRQTWSVRVRRVGKKSQTRDAR